MLPSSLLMKILFFSGNLVQEMKNPWKISKKSQNNTQNLNFIFGYRFRVKTSYFFTKQNTNV